MLQVRNFYAPGWCSKETFYSAAPTLYFKLQPTSKEKGHVLSSWPSGIKLDNGFFLHKMGFSMVFPGFPIESSRNVQKPCLTTGSGVLKDHAQELHFLHANDLQGFFAKITGESTRCHNDPCESSLNGTTHDLNHWIHLDSGFFGISCHFLCGTKPTCVREQHSMTKKKNAQCIRAAPRDKKSSKRPGAHTTISWGSKWHPQLNGHPL